MSEPTPSPRPTPAIRPIVFGLVLPASAKAAAPRVDALLAWIGERAGLPLERRDAESYETLAADIREGRADAAWLPPIVFVRLGDVVEPVGSILRDGKAAYESALIVRANSRIKAISQLRGARAGWVDRWSAAGFVLPRVKLALLGVDPRTLFRSEHFYGSHRAMIEALRDGACDVAGTYARGADPRESDADADESELVKGGAWSEVEGADVRVVATFGAIPPDVIAVRKALDDGPRAKIVAAVRAAPANDEAKAMLRDVFGGDALTEGAAPGYESLKSALDMAASRGLFD